MTELVLFPPQFGMHVMPAANARHPYSLYDVVIANVLVIRHVTRICLSVFGEVQHGPQS